MGPTARTLIRGRRQLRATRITSVSRARPASLRVRDGLRSVGVGTRAILSRTWGAPGRHPAAEPRGFEDLLTLDDVDRILTTTSLRTPSFRLVKAGEQIPESACSRCRISGIIRAPGDAQGSRSCSTTARRSCCRDCTATGSRSRRSVARSKLQLGHPCQVNATSPPPCASGARGASDRTTSSCCRRSAASTGRSTRRPPNPSATRSRRTWVPAASSICPREPFRRIDGRRVVRPPDGRGARWANVAGRPDRRLWSLAGDPRSDEALPWSSTPKGGSTEIRPTHCVRG